MDALRLGLARGIEVRRRLLGMSVAALAGASGISRATINKRKKWKNNEFLSRWFGEKLLSRRQIRVTRRRIRLIARLLETGVKIIWIPEGAVGTDHCKKARAFTSWLTPLEICPKFFDGDDETRAMTIIHELVHAIGHPHQTIGHDKKICIAKTSHTPEDRWLLAHMANKRPIRSRRNPANFAVLFRDLFMGRFSSIRKPKGACP